MSVKIQLSTRRLTTSVESVAGAKVNSGRLDWGLTPKRRYLCSLKFCDFFKRIEHIELRFCIWSNLVLCSVFPSIPWGVGKSRLLSSGTILLLARKLSPVQGEVEPGSILRLFSVIWFGFCVFETRYIELRLALNSQCSPGCGPCDPPLATASWAIGLQARATTPGVKHAHYVYSGIAPAGAHRPWSVVSYSCIPEHHMFLRDCLSCI